MSRLARFRAPEFSCHVMIVQQPRTGHKHFTMVPDLCDDTGDDLLHFRATKGWQTVEELLLRVNSCTPRHVESRIAESLVSRT